jgi:hypothetical protein
MFSLILAAILNFRCLHYELKYFQLYVAVRKSNTTLECCTCQKVQESVDPNRHQNQASSLVADHYISILIGNNIEIQYGRFKK